MSDIIKIESGALKNYFNDFTREKTKFKNACNNFNSSYINTCGDPYIRKMANNLAFLYSKINTGYENINTWWEKYIKEAEATENSITNNSISGVSEGLIRGALGRLPKLQSFRLNEVRYTQNSLNVNIDTKANTNPLKNLLSVFGEAKVAIEGISSSVVSGISNAKSKALEWWNKDAVPALTLGATLYIEAKRIQANMIRDTAAKVGATAGTAVASVVEGVGKFLEGIVDAGATIGSMAAQGAMFQQEAELRLYGIDTGLDLDAYNKSIQESTQAFVSKEWVTGWADDFYKTDVGKALKENSFAFDTVRSVGNGVGYMAGAAGLSAFTGFVGVPIVGGTTTGVTAFATVAGVGKGAQEAWNNDATYNEGLLYGAATGAWEGLQYFIGSKLINNSNIFGREGSKLFIDGARGRAMESAARVVLDAVDGGAEGLVQPFLESLYVDGFVDEDGNYIDFSGNKDFADVWCQIFMHDGGWANVATQAAMGGIGSAISEYFDLGKYFDAEKKAGVLEDASKAVSETLDDLAKGKLKVNGKDMEIPDVLRNRFGDLMKDNEIDLNNLSGKEGYDKLSEVFFRMKGALQLLSEDVPDNMKSEYYSLMQAVNQTEMGGRILSKNGDYGVASSILGKRLGDMLDGFTEMEQRIYNGVHLKFGGKNLEVPEILQGTFGELIKDNEINIDNLYSKEGYDKLSEVFFRMKGALQLLSEDVPDNMKSEYYSLMQNVTEAEMGGRILSKSGDYTRASRTLGARLGDMLDGFTDMEQRIYNGVHLKFGGKNLEVPEILQNKLGDLIKDNEINIDNISNKEGYDKLSEVFFRIKGALQNLGEDMPDNLKDEYNSFMQTVNKVEMGGRISSKSGDYTGASRTLGATLGDMLEEFTGLQQRIDNGVHLKFNGKNLEIPEVLRGRFNDLIKDNEIYLDNLSGKEGYDSLSKIFSRTKGALEGLKDFIPEGNQSEYKEFMQYIEQGDSLGRFNAGNGDYSKAIKNLESRLGQMLGYFDGAQLKSVDYKMGDALGAATVAGKTATDAIKSAVKKTADTIDDVTRNIPYEPIKDVKFDFNGRTYTLPELNKNAFDGLIKDGKLDLTGLSGKELHSKLDEVFGVLSRYYPQIAGEYASTNKQVQDILSSIATKDSLQKFFASQGNYDASNRTIAGIVANMLDSMETLRGNFEGVEKSLFDDIPNPDGYRYGVDQGIIKKMKRYEKLNFDWIDEPSFREFLSKEFPDVPDAYEQILDGSKTMGTYWANKMIKYIQSRSGSYEEALQTFTNAFKIVDNPERTYLMDKLVNQGLSSVDADKLLDAIDYERGVCSLAAFANSLLERFADKPELFREMFGYDLFKDINGTKTINSAELLLDIYTYMNSNLSGEGKMFNWTDGKLSLIDLDTSKELALSGGFGTRDDLIDKFLRFKSKDASVEVGFTDELDYGQHYLPKLIDKIKEAKEAGKQVIFSISRGIKMYNKDGIVELVDTGHAVYITEVLDDGIMVSSWGEPYKIKLEDFVEKDPFKTNISFAIQYIEFLFKERGGIK